MINPEIYHDVFDCNNANVVNVSNSNYLFSMVEFGRDSENQLLDSSPEKVVASKLKTHFEMIKVKMWAKNPRSGNVYGQYLNEYNVVSSSHFDFIIKFPDSNTSNNNYLYIEVKGKNDIDASKAVRLRKVCGRYFAPAFNRNSQQELGDIKIVICIATVDGDNITHEYFYDSNKFGGKNLNSMTFGEVLQVLSTNLS